MTPPQMFVQIFFAGEADAGATFAVLVGTHAGGFGSAVLAVDFALVAEEAPGVGEAADVVAFGLFADVGAVVFVHVFSMRFFSLGFGFVQVRGKGVLTSIRTSSRRQEGVVHTPDQHSKGSPAHSEEVPLIFYCSLLSAYCLPHLVPHSWLGRLRLESLG